MNVSMSKKTIESMGWKNFEPFGITEDSMRWSKEHTFDLTTFTLARAKAFLALLEKYPTIRGMTARIEDTKTWIQILTEGPLSKRVRSIKHFEPMLKQYLKTTPNYWLYERVAHLDDQHAPWVVSDITYKPATKQNGWVTPAHVVISGYVEELGSYVKYHETFWQEDVQDMTVRRALAEKGYQVETPELRAQYDKNKAKYEEVWDKVGVQFTAVGIGENISSAKRESWWQRDNSQIKMDKDAPANVVIDILSEGSDGDDDNTKTRRNSQPPTSSYWGVEECDFDGSEDDNDNDLKPGDEDEDQEERVKVLDVPLYPTVTVFDLKRHMRIRLHATQIERYEYDRQKAKKLILPDEVTGLVELLLSHKGKFQDIVGSKGQGAIILCAGPPGTGKTLTSEVYSEAMERPLYSVQCSQLGTSPDELEKELLKVFARSVRWNAILLLDEADVYVATRGSDMEQNAIVGVFLRVLEYYKGVLFMTTNRFDLVDDAIASRCLARIDYQIPTPADQKRIWRTLCDTAGIKMTDAEIDKTVKQFPNLSGRDVKNLLKLASMMDPEKSGLTVGNIKYCKQFKPTKDISNAKVPDDA